MRPYKRGTKATTRPSYKGSSVKQLTRFRNIKNPPNVYLERTAYKKGEVKRVDHTFEAGYATPYVPDALAKNYFNINTTGNFQALMIQQGTGSSQRIGRMVNLKSIRIRFRLLATANTLAGQSMARLMLVYDKQCNGGYPATSVLLANLNEVGTTSAFDPDGDLNPVNLDRFIVLMDSYHIIPPRDGTATGAFSTVGPSEEECYVIDKFIKLKGLENSYSASSSPMVIANNSSGALYLFSVGSVAAGAEPWVWYGKCRLSYYDN